MSEYGVINRRVTAATLMPYPAVIKTGAPNVQLSLSEAYKLFQISEVTFCHCKKSCNTRQCRCYAISTICTSRCHKYNTAHCRNYRGKSHNIQGVDDSHQIISDHDLILPVFGGDIMINGNLYRFFNTCAVDTWIDIFATLMKDAPSFSLCHVTLPSEFKDLLETVQKGEIEKAKWLVAEQNNITIDKRAINFYANERTLIIQPFFQESLTRQVLPKCISPICRNPEDSTAISLPPDFSELMEVTKISKAEFIDKINN